MRVGSKVIHEGLAQHIAATQGVGNVPGRMADEWHVCRVPSAE